MHRALQGRCGVFCGDCEVYIAYSTDNVEAQKRISGEFNRKGKSITPEQVKCLGCKGNANNVWRSPCKVRLCAEEKGVEFCYQCLNFPCDELEKSFASHPGARESLRLISKIGPDAWLHQMMNKNKKVEPPEDDNPA
jgi:hypothetical protein